MKKTFTFKSLLVAAALLCGVTGAWADTETVTVLSQDYEGYEVGDITAETLKAAGWNLQSKNNKNVYKIVQGAADAANATKYFDFYYPDGGANRNQSWNFSVTSSLTNDNWSLSFAAALNPGTNNSANVFCVVGTKSGNVTSTNSAVTNPILKLQGTAAAAVTYKPTLGATDYDEELTLTSGAWYNFTVKATSLDEAVSKGTLYVKIASGETTVWEKTVEDFDFSAVGLLYGFCWNSPRGYSRLNLDDVLVTKEIAAGTCDAPTYTMTGVNGTSRKFTLACGTDGATLYYATTELAADATGWTEYTGEVTTDAATIYAVAKKGTAVSEVISFATGAGTAIALNVPVINVAGMTAEGDYSIFSFGAWSDQASVQFAPAATLSATFTGADGTAQNVTLPYTPATAGTLTVTASAAGYTSAMTSLAVYPKYIQSWISTDFSTLTDENAAATLGEGWGKTETTGRWASWDASKEPYTYYQYTKEGVSVPNVTVESNLRMRNVVLLNLGYGLARGDRSEPINFLNTNAATIVAVKAYNGYGKDVETNTHYDYFIGGGSFGTSNGNVLVQAAYYIPASVTLTLGANGYATFASTYALDLDNLPAGLKAYKGAVSDDASRINFTEVSGKVRANTGLLFEGATGTTYEVPVASTGSAVSSNDLKVNTTGTTFEAAENTTYFAMVKDATPLVFRRVDPATIAIPANKAYVAVTTAVSAEGRLAATFGEATAIKGVESVEAADAAVYNLSGQRVKKATKGVYIVNGKKAIVK